MQHAGHSTTHGWRGLWRHFIQHVRDDWPATLFVAAAVAVVHNKLGWFDAIDGYAFVAIGNASSVPVSLELPLLPKQRTYGAKEAKALVVQIDQTAQESRYLDRAPLNRCRLHDDLRLVYAAMGKLNQQRKDRHEQRFGPHLNRPGGPEIEKLDVLVVDLDISPALWLTRPDAATAEEHRCQRELYDLIKQSAANSPRASPYPIRTVLMTPLDIKDGVTKSKQQEWLDEMKKGAGVTFGRPGLPLDYGLVIKQYCDPGSLAGAAHRLIPTRQNKCIGKTLKEQARDPEMSSKRHSELIDPRKYRSGVVPIALSEVPGQNAGAEVAPFNDRLHRELGIDSLSTADDGETNFKAVFFGAAFGEDDRFITPLGEVYGVEVHAAGFLSLLDPPSTDQHVWQFVFDVLFGFAFGFAIARSWDGYFRLKLSGDPNQRLWAPAYVFALGGWVLVLVILLSIVSWALLGLWGIWSSPIPIAIGMLIESFVSGSVAQGIREANHLMGQGRPPRKTFAESLQKFFGGDFIELWKKEKLLAAAIVAFRLVVWIIVVGLALFFH